MDQGFEYLAAIQANKDSCIVEFNEKQNQHFDRDDIDVSSSRVIFVAPESTKTQKGNGGYKDLSFELWEVNRYAAYLLLTPIGRLPKQL